MLFSCISYFNYTVNIHFDIRYNNKSKRQSPKGIKMSSDKAWGDSLARIPTLRNATDFVYRFLVYSRIVSHIRLLCEWVQSQMNLMFAMRRLHIFW